MAKTLVLVHGRHYKPPMADLQKLWLDAIEAGIRRDFPAKVSAFKNAKIEFVYYGDISNKFLSERNGERVPNDIKDRQAALDALKLLKANQFTKASYKALPGYNPWMEALADFASGPLSFVGLSDSIIKKVAPDIEEYWEDQGFGSSVREVFAKGLERALAKPGEVCVVAHSLGTMISYDTFWKMSHTSEYRKAPWDRPIDRWITLGAPLGDSTVQKNLKGADEKPAFRYPTNVKEWFNVAAEDDYISHDQTVADDFKAMKSTTQIKDKSIYNLAVRAGKSNPHNESGYLIHPYVTGLIANWL